MRANITQGDWEQLPPILTPEQVAAVAGVKPERVLRWATAGKLRGVKIGRQWRFPKTVLEEGTQP